jgi:hypothetical protein
LRATPLSRQRRRADHWRFSINPGGVPARQTSPAITKTPRGPDRWRYDLLNPEATCCVTLCQHCIPNPLFITLSQGMKMKTRRKTVQSKFSEILSLTPRQAAFDSPSCPRRSETRTYNFKHRSARQGLHARAPRALFLRQTTEPCLSLLLFLSPTALRFVFYFCALSAEENNYQLN